MFTIYPACVGMLNEVLYFVSYATVSFPQHDIKVVNISSYSVLAYVSVKCLYSSCIPLSYLFLYSWGSELYFGELREKGKQLTHMCGSLKVISLFLSLLTISEVNFRWFKNLICHLSWGEANKHQFYVTVIILYTFWNNIILLPES